MKVFWRLVPVGVALVALLLVGIQTLRLGRLERAQAAQAALVRGAGAQEPDAAARVKRLERRIASLEDAVRRLAGIALTRAPGPGEKAPGADPVLLGWLRDELKSLRNDVDSALTGDSLATEEGRQKLKDLLRNVRREERQERMQRFEQMAQHLQQEGLSQLAREAGLDQGTTDKIDNMLTQERDQLRAVMRAFREGEKEIPAAIAEARKIMDQTDVAARGLLSDDQNKAYEKMREENPAGRWLQRRLMGRGGGGGGGG